jgi:hypothetical protein
LIEVEGLETVRKKGVVAHSSGKTPSHPTPQPFVSIYPKPNISQETTPKPSPSPPKRTTSPPTSSSRGSRPPPKSRAPAPKAPG